MSDEYRPSVLQGDGGAAVGVEADMQGAAALGGEWQEVPTGGNPAFRFFRVKVALP